MFDFVQIPIKADAGEADYLEMIYRLLGTSNDEEDLEAEARPSLLNEKETLFTLNMTLVHRPAAVEAPVGAAPLPTVLRAYGAYGVPADLSFAPDDLPLLDRYAVTVNIVGHVLQLIQCTCCKSRWTPCAALAT